MKLRARAVLAVPAVLVLLSLGACRVLDGNDDDDGNPTAPTSAQITITVTPDPLRFLVVCPPGSTQCFGSLDATVVFAETAGVGGRVEHVDLALFDVGGNQTLTSIRLGSDWLRQQAGTDRIEADGRLSIRPIIEGYPFPAGQPRPTLEVLMDVQFSDDLGNTVQKSGRFPVV